MPRETDPRLRLVAWIVVATALLAFQLVWKTAAGVVAAELLVLALSALLLTTPPDAIRLPRPTSEILILAGTFVLQRNAGVHSICVALLICVFLLLVARRARISPWWAAVICWNPLLTATLLAARAAG